MSTYPEEFKALEEENKRLEAENEKLKKAISIADKDRQDAWRTLKVIRDALKK